MYGQTERPSIPGYQVALMRRSMILVGSLLMIPAMVQAQSRGAAHAVAARPAVSAPRAMPHVVAPVMHVPSGSRTVSRGTYSRSQRVTSGPSRVIHRTRSTSPGTAIPRRSTAFDSNAPGLGFDEVHFQATHPRRANRNRRGNGFAAFFPFYDGGFFLPSAPGFADDATGEAPPPEEVADNEDPDPSQHARTHYFREQEAPVASRDSVAEKVKTNDEYVFVRRDGTLLFAVAYSLENGTLRYVTAEGLRRSITLDSLDLGATQQFNEQRGLSFRVPA